ncbi:hypothetical protein [Paenibacillus macquariensis]|uniref:hypothetical protein n=1 Tax=Paenibacillus macquariensis TaxID=948756 RepID=UPI000A6D423B|nr:hypothetical protein [Paenibacillus macquariensis]MEC0093105.1 hypothetical protein [Paenibacillus macquariensis]
MGYFEKNTSEACISISVQCQLLGKNNIRVVDRYGNGLFLRSLLTSDFLIGYRL